MKKIKNFIDRLAKANKETFGNNTLSCCNLDKDCVKTTRNTDTDKKYK